jgi:hypothetical protein
MLTARWRFTLTKKKLFGFSCCPKRVVSKCDKKTRLLPNHKLYSFIYFVLNYSFSKIFVQQTKRQKKNYNTIFILSFMQTNNNFYIFSTTKSFILTLYILFGFCLYFRILYRCEEEAKNCKTCFFFKLE